MIQQEKSLRRNISVIILLLYLLPVVLLSAFSLGMMPANDSWNIFSIGLLMGLCGTLILFWLMFYWENTLGKGLENQTNEHPFTHSFPLNRDVTTDHVGDQQPHTELLNEMELQTEQLHLFQKEKEEWQQHIEMITTELANFKESSQTQLHQKDQLLKEALQTIQEQLNTIDQQLHQINVLENIQKELKYEIKTLLQFSTIDPELEDKENSQIPIEKPSENHIPHISQKPSFAASPYTSTLRTATVETQETALDQLKRCIDIATKMTGAHHQSNNARFLDLPIDNYTLELRRLFDSLRIENGCIIIFYSQKENKLLFANTQVKNALGWSPEKFTQDFSEIIQEGLQEWKKGLSALATESSVTIRLPFKTKAGAIVAMDCSLGTISTGLFRQHIMGVIFN